MRESWTTDFSGKVRSIVSSAQRYHDDFVKAKRFTGPSLYFHRRAVATAGDPRVERHLEYVYAAVASWGMHRMGPGGAKMLDFAEFRRSALDLKPLLQKARGYVLGTAAYDEWRIVEEIFMGMRIMKSGSDLVGNSKAMAHMLPNLIPPIDRSYTLRFLRETTVVPQSKEAQWQLMKSMVEGFFARVARDRSFAARAEDWLRRKDRCLWDTSVPKIIDNLLVGAVVGR